MTAAAGQISAGGRWGPLTWDEAEGAGPYGGTQTSTGDLYCGISGVTPDYSLLSICTTGGMMMAVT